MSEAKKIATPTEIADFFNNSTEKTLGDYVCLSGVYGDSIRLKRTGDSLCSETLGNVWVHYFNKFGFVCNEFILVPFIDEDTFILEGHTRDRSFCLVEYKRKNRNECKRTLIAAIEDYVMLHKNEIQQGTKYLLDCLHGSLTKKT